MKTLRNPWTRLVFLLTAVASTSQSQVRTITPTGQYSVGRQYFVWTDSSRRDPTDSTRYREIPVWIWYPAGGSRGALTLEAPLPGEWQSNRIDAFRAKFNGAVADAMRTFMVYSRTDAPIATGTTRFPVLVFTPGLSWLATDYSILIEDLASHGYIVIGISPVGFSDPTVLHDGQVIRRSLGMGEKIGTDQSYVHDDAQFALNHAKQLDKTASSFLYHRLDLEKIGAFGHSLGGTTSLVLAARDTSIRAAINIDGDPMGDVVNVRPHQPILLISSESPTIDEAPPNPLHPHMDLVQQGLERSEKRRTDQWKLIASQAPTAYRIRMLGAHHLDLEDAALASGLLTTRQERWMKFGSIDPTRSLTIEADLVRSFFDQVLQGNITGDLFSAPEHRYPETRADK